MEKLTFRRQWWLGMAVLVLCFVLATHFKVGVISNIGWVLFGLAFVIHPVCPEVWKWRYSDDEKRMKQDFRIAGVVTILIGLITRFGV